MFKTHLHTFTAQRVDCQKHEFLFLKQHDCCSVPTTGALDLRPQVAVWLSSGTGTTRLGGRRPHGSALLMNVPLLHT